MERYILQQGTDPSYWICTDQDNGLVCKFEQGNFNSNQEFTLLSDSHASPLHLAKLSREMSDWLIKHHQDKL